MFVISFCDVLEIEKKCDASTNEWNCCTPSKPCDEGEGDCNHDSECTGNLKCGINNCKSYDSAWSKVEFDCCMVEGKNSHKSREC